MPLFCQFFSIWLYLLVDVLLSLLQDIKNNIHNNSNKLIKNTFFIDFLHIKKYHNKILVVNYELDDRYINKVKYKLCMKLYFLLKLIIFTDNIVKIILKGKLL